MTFIVTCSVSNPSHPEEKILVSLFNDPVLDLTLLGEVLRAPDGRVQTLDGQERGQGGGVGRDHHQDEQPPEAGGNAGGEGPENANYYNLKSVKKATRHHHPSISVPFTLTFNILASSIIMSNSPSNLSVQYSANYEYH